MEKGSRPLWQILLLTRDSNKNIRLTWDECFALLEYDAELLTDGFASNEIRPAIMYHLSPCSDCQEKIDEWLEKLNSAQPNLHLC
jgi:hypothetical protein